LVIKKKKTTETSTARGNSKERGRNESMTYRQRESGGLGKNGQKKKGG